MRMALQTGANTSNEPENDGKEIHSVQQGFKVH